MVRLGFTELPFHISYLRTREEDYYIALVGELFDRLKEPYTNSIDWSRLGNALAQVASSEIESEPSFRRIVNAETAVFAAAAFYIGGYSASAYLTLKSLNPKDLNEIQLGCYELLCKPTLIKSEIVGKIVEALRIGNPEAISELIEFVSNSAAVALKNSPEDWVGWRLFQQLLLKFERTNIRAALPDGNSEFWDPFVRSLLQRKPPAWDFFPSQIEAIKNGLLDGKISYSLQMPTGAGKTALSETLLFYHLNHNKNDVAILLVPYRSLASELRGTLVKRLINMGLPARCAYGGTVPTGDEVRNLDQIRAIVATPEALSGLLSTEPDFFSRVSLVICDEGHLLDGEARGVGLELLLARMRARESGPPKFVFVSAIVPNIEEINVWLGGRNETVIRSEYRPALAEFSVLQVLHKNSKSKISLQLHPHLEDSRFSIDRFLSAGDFTYHNPKTRRLKTYAFNSVKSHAIAAARKALPMGAVAVFAANKGGNQGAIGLAEELLSQLSCPLSMPEPIQFVKEKVLLQSAVEYFTLEYGPSWVGTKILEAGTILHHGDIPQESREVIEILVRKEIVHLAICTSTLAEGVNLPIRTLVLYSVQRRGPNGAMKNLLARDIKNLVGRAGRAGSTTKGLVICANPKQWHLIHPVANQQPGERVSGALLDLMKRLQSALSLRSITLTNEILEREPALHTLIDGIDATLIDLATEELGEEELVRIAGELSIQTFAARQATGETKALMKHVFELRAKRVSEIKNEGRINWIRESGARPRMLESVEKNLLPLIERWDSFESATDPKLTEAMLKWAVELPEMKQAIKKTFGDSPPETLELSKILIGWIEGNSLFELSRSTDIDIDLMLSIHSKIISYAFQAIVEQGVALLKKLLDSGDYAISQIVVDYPEYLHFGVPTLAAKVLAGSGIRHRRAAVALGKRAELLKFSNEERSSILKESKILLENREEWSPILGNLVLENTLQDLQEFSNPEID